MHTKQTYRRVTRQTYHETQSRADRSVDTTTCNNFFHSAILFYVVVVVVVARFLGPSSVAGSIEAFGITRCNAAAVASNHS